MVARVGFESATFRTQGTEPTTEPPRPTNIVANRLTRQDCHFSLFTISVKLHSFMYVRTQTDSSYSSNPLWP